MDEKSSGHFGGPSRGRRFSRQLMPKIDKPSERELMEKKERRGGKRSQPAAEKRARRGTQIYAWPVCPPGTFENARSSTLLRGERSFRRETRPIETRSKFRWTKIGEILRACCRKKKENSSKRFYEKTKLILSKYINASYLFSLADAPLKISSYLYEKSSRNAESVKSTLF